MQVGQGFLGIETPELERVAPVAEEPVAVVEVEPAVSEAQKTSQPAILRSLAEPIGVLGEVQPAIFRSLAEPIGASASTSMPIAPTSPAIYSIASTPQVAVKPQQPITSPPIIDTQKLNNAQAYQLEQLAFEHPDPGTGAADLKEEIRDRLTMGGGTPAQVMAQMDQEVDNQEDQQVEQARKPEPVGYSPTLQEMRDWLQDAKINQRPANYLRRIRELSVEFLAETPLATQPVRERDPEARNPAFVLSEAAQVAMERDRVASEQRRTPTRQMLLSWYSAARATGQGSEVLDRIQALGQAQVAGTTEAEKPAGERSLGFRNPEFVLGRGDYLAASGLIRQVAGEQTRGLAGAGRQGVERAA